MQICILLKAIVNERTNEWYHIGERECRAEVVLVVHTELAKLLDDKPE